MTTYQVLCRNVTSQRLKLNLTQHDLAIRSGVAERVIGTIANGRNPSIRLSTVEAIAAALGLTTAQLLDENLPQYEGFRQRVYKTRFTRIDDTSIAAPHRPGPQPKVIMRGRFKKIKVRISKPTGRPQPRNHPWRKS